MVSHFGGSQSQCFLESISGFRVSLLPKISIAKQTVHIRVCPPVLDRFVENTDGSRGVA